MNGFAKVSLPFGASLKRPDWLNSPEETRLPFSNSARFGSAWARTASEPERMRLLACYVGADYWMVHPFETGRSLPTGSRTDHSAAPERTILPLPAFLTSNRLCDTSPKRLSMGLFALTVLRKMKPFSFQCI